MHIYEKIIKMFNATNSNYVEKIHPAQGNGNEVAKIHNAEIKQGAKAILLKAKPTGYYLAVFSAAQRLDAKLAKHALNVKNISFASIEETKEFTECEIGAVPPFSFNPQLSLIVDPKLLENKTIFFNIGRLENSVTLNVDDYIKLIPEAKISSITMN